MILAHDCHFYPRPVLYDWSLTKKFYKEKGKKKKKGVSWFPPISSKHNWSLRIKKIDEKKTISSLFSSMSPTFSLSLLLCSHFLYPLHIFLSSSHFLYPLHVLYISSLILRRSLFTSPHYYFNNFSRDIYFFIISLEILDYFLNNFSWEIITSL